MAQLFSPRAVPAQTELLSNMKEKVIIEDMKSELRECDVLLAFNPNHVNRAVRQRQLNMMSRKLESFDRRLSRISQHKLSPETYLQLNQRAQRLRMQLAYLIQEEANLSRSQGGPSCRLPIAREEETRLLQHINSQRKSWRQTKESFNEYGLPRH